MAATGSLSCLELLVSTLRSLFLRFAFLLLTFFKVLENLHPLIVSIGDIDLVALVDENAARQPELTRANSALAESQQILSGLIKDLNGIEKRVHDIDVVLAVDGYALRTGEVS